MRSLLKKVALLILLLALLPGCKKGQRSEDSPFGEELVKNPFQRDLSEIKTSGVLKAITTYSPTGYFLYRGETMGFEYEVLKRFSKEIGVKLEIVIAKNVDSLIPMLLKGEGDLIATGYTITSERKKWIDFTEPYLTTHQVLVQKKPENWRKMGIDRIKKQLVTNVVDLIGDTVSVKKETAFYDRLVSLSKELGDTIYINILPGNLTVEETMEMVNEGKIKYTIADSNIALINQSYYPDLYVNTAVSLSQRIAWAVRKNSPGLLRSLNEFLNEFTRTTTYHVIYNKYFKNRSSFKKRLGSKYYTETTGKISQYSETVKKYAKQYGFDWRLIKSMIYQESRFKNQNSAWTGASGLLQIMPATAKSLGITNVKDPEQNIRGGLKYLRKLYNNWGTVPDSVQRLKFALASYNCGYGHVIDAKSLARKYRKDTLNWDQGLDEFILKLAKPEFYNDPVVKYGYVRGKEPYKYVKEIFDRYETYKNFVKE
jgi:membrane-bound lytic murein transglycosylase F